MPRAPSSTKGKKASRSGRGNNNGLRHDPLGAQMQADELTSKFGTVSEPGRRNKQKEVRQTDGIETADEPSLRITGAKAGQFIDPKLSRNILRLAREQQQEIEAEEAQAGLTEAEANGKTDFRIQSKITLDDSDEEDDEGEEDDGELDSNMGDEGEQGEEAYEELEIDPEDAKWIDKFAENDDETGRPGAPAGGNKTLADLIMEKIEAAERQNAQGGIHEKAARGAEGGDMPMPPGINPKVIEVYTKVGELLSRYKSGPLPKAFKIIPSLPAWENILYITNPPTWTPHATLAATRIFVSNLKANQTQKFFELVLLDKIRDEIAETGKASYQMYEAIKKALFKPAAFFKGVLFPLCETGCTLKEAAIISSVLTRVSIPILHSAAALLRLAEMHYAGPTSLFIRVLLDKKYALPYKVVDALVFHFLRFSDPTMGVERVEGGGRRMPVLWHQSLLVFSQRYKQDLTPDQKAALVDLLRVQWHEGISPEVRRELNSGKARGEMLDEPVDEDDDDMMSV
ncbi:Bystin-domain-containing protein [Meira miltonrushii]|uniref:Bystin-domain-containing protein n=1 Tax=Meira miltonrushii TaxID=1280837 RepID=A0A316VN17_9BASI|nr:Bystin-domain-containing protein [Meira miltonrushii]PWN37491.1 Bystin-domain-containing protein [Meira miltonrushii]